METTFDFFLYIYTVWLLKVDITVIITACFLCLFSYLWFSFALFFSLCYKILWLNVRSCQWFNSYFRCCCCCCCYCRKFMNIFIVYNYNHTFIFVYKRKLLQNHHYCRHHHRHHHHEYYSSYNSQLRPTLRIHDINLLFIFTSVLVVVYYIGLQNTVAGEDSHAHMISIDIIRKIP